jgi:hypothetical protein
MKLPFVALLVAVCPLTVLGQSSTKKPPPPPHPNGPANEEVQTEKIEAPGQAPAVPLAPASSAGHLEPAQVKALMHKIYLAQFRLNDLLTQVHPDKWKMPPAARQSLEQTLESLHKALDAEESWRSQFENRPDSLYLGFQTYVAISAVLPRLDGMAHAVSHYENGSFGAQYSQSENQFFDLQQAIEPHLAYLLKNQDEAQLIAQTNLASCENELNFAEHDKEGRAIPMKNIAPVFRGHKPTPHATTAAGGAKKAPANENAAGKPVTKPPNKTQKKLKTDN